MKTIAELAADIIALETPEQADDFIAERVVELREMPGETRTNEELDALERATICSWFAVHNHHQHVRMLKLFRPAWPPIEDTETRRPGDTETLSASPRLPISASPVPLSPPTS